MGSAKSFYPMILQPALLAGTVLWIMEWADSAGVLGEGQATLLRTGRTAIARLGFGIILIGGVTLWWIIPICLDIKVEDSSAGKKKQITVIGYANAFGSPYLILWTIFFSLVYTTTQLTGQIVLALSAIALVAHLEVIDSVRDVKSLETAFTSATPSAALDLESNGLMSPAIKFADIVPVALLGMHAFYGTGHQSTISSLQWKSAFLLTPTVTYPFSPITVALNTLGPWFLAGLAAPLLALWNRTPLQSKTSTEPEGKNTGPADQIRRESTFAALGIMMYYATLLLGTAVSAALLRRHLMVWKVFAPRFMAAVAGVLAVDVAVLIGVGVGVDRIAKRIERMFGVRSSS